MTPDDNNAHLKFPSPEQITRFQFLFRGNPEKHYARPESGAALGVPKPIKMAHAMAEEPTGRYLARLVKSAEPMVIVAGPSLGTREGKPGPRVVGDDKELLDRTAHVRSKKETMMQFFARTGLGAYQIRTMSKSEISHFVETASQHESVQPPTSTFGRPAPQRFVLEA
jgi:hypothetical protein